MNKESLEHLSSLMDGEMSRETGLFMTRRLSSDDEFQRLPFFQIKVNATNCFDFATECIK